MEKNNFSTGGAYIETNQEQQVIRGEGLVQTLDDIGNIVISATPQGVPIYVKNVAKVAPRTAGPARRRDARRQGRGP